jgi:hypothetical protein
MNEQRKDRERQADGEIAAEQRCDDTWCRTREINPRGV